MSILKLTNPTYVMVLLDTATGETALGGKQPLVHDELEKARVILLKNGDRGGSEQLRLKVYADDGYSHLLAASSWRDLDDVAAEYPDLDTGDFWVGYIDFEFSTRYHRNKNSVYYYAIETSNYTRSAEAFWLGLRMDWGPNLDDDNVAPRVAHLETYGRRLLRSV